MIGAHTTLRWNGPLLLDIAGKATADNKAAVARLLASRSKSIVRRFAIEPGTIGGYGRISGYVASQISPGRDVVFYGFPAYQVQYGTARSAPRDFVWRAVDENTNRIISILSGGFEDALMKVDKRMVRNTK